MCLWTDEPGQIRSRRCRDGMVANKYAVLPNINCPPMRYCKLKWVLLLLRLALHIFFAGVDIYWINLLLTGGICSVSENRRVLSPPLSSVLNSYTSSPLPFLLFSFCCLLFPKLFCEQKFNLKIVNGKHIWATDWWNSCCLSPIDLDFSVLPEAVKGN